MPFPSTSTVPSFVLAVFTSTPAATAGGFVAGTSDAWALEPAATGGLDTAVLEAAATGTFDTEVLAAATVSEADAAAGADVEATAAGDELLEQPLSSNAPATTTAAVIPEILLLVNGFLLFEVETSVR